MIDIKDLKILSQKLSVLYVEDEPELRASIQTYLQKLFGVVETAKDGLEALHKFQHQTFDIVISDIQMPQLDGLTMSEQIRQRQPDQEIIIVSAYSDMQYFVRAIEIGVSGYIIKPVNYHQMNETLYKSVLKLTKFKENQLYSENLEKLVAERSAALVAAEAEKAENFEKTLLALVEMIEDRDAYTGGHSQRVAEYSKLIAQVAGFSEQECDLVYRAGVLHDIGKVATPDTILLKPGRLNELEYRLIQEHVTVGYQLLSKIPMYQSLAEIMHFHHERYDGKGYPKGLKADEIPPLSRVMIIADAFDAMTTNRIYKVRKSFQAAIAELKKLSGSQFDPQIVPKAVQALSQLDELEEVDQQPISKIEQERFSYFYRDQLTGTYNRDYLDFVLNRNRQLQSFKHIYVFFLHGIGEFNKQHGWTAGDRILVQLGEFLIQKFSNDVVFRIMGDDFVVLDKSKSEEQLLLIEQAEFLKNTGLTLSHNVFDIHGKQIYDLQTFEHLLF